MAEENQGKSAVKKQHGILCTIIGTLIWSLVLSIIIEWIGITFFWSEEGYRHSQAVMLQEFAWFSSEFQYSLLHNYPVQLAVQAIEWLNQWFFVKSGFQAWLNEPKTDTIEIFIFHYLRAYIESLFYVIITFLIRLTIIVLTGPLFILAALVGLVDGLVMRDIRRFGIGKESAFKYHHAKRAVGPVMIGAWIIYLSIPFSIHPNWILIPSAVLFGFMIRTTAANFKKHL